MNHGVVERVNEPFGSRIWPDWKVVEYLRIGSDSTQEGCCMLRWLSDRFESGQALKGTIGTDNEWDEFHPIILENLGYGKAETRVIVGVEQSIRCHIPDNRILR